MSTTNAFSASFSSEFDPQVRDGFITDEQTIRELVPNGSKIPDDQFTGAWEAADQWVAVRTRFTGETPPDLVQAVALMTGRILARRNSPDGLTGMGDLGQFRVPNYDPDIRSLMGPWMPVVFG